MLSSYTFPTKSSTNSYTIEILSMDIALEDYEAVLESRDDIIGVFGPTSTWPQVDLTIRQNILDLAWHEKEFQKNSTFAYVVRDSESGVYLGCLYIYESVHPEYDAECIYWMRSSKKELFATYESELHDWICDILGIQKPAYPGRILPWQAYLKNS